MEQTKLFIILVCWGGGEGLSTRVWGGAYTCCARGGSMGGGGGGLSIVFSDQPNTWS